MNTLSTSSSLMPPSPTTRRKYTQGVVLLFFVLAGVFQTILAYSLFERSGDHIYFVDMANNGPEETIETLESSYQLKAMAAGQVFYLLTTPSRLLGGLDIGHVIWTRILALVGFVFAYDWARRTLCRPGPLQAQVWSDSFRARFMVLCLIYPGQLAWTTSLLRDGVSCALFFTALLLWSKRYRLLSLVVLGAALSLRPEFLLLAALMAIMMFLANKGFLRQRRLITLLALTVTASLAGFSIRQPISEFSQIAFENADVGGSYPSIAHILDVPGYLMVLLQACMDPIGLSVWGTASPFQLFEVIFFLYLTGRSLSLLRQCSARTAAVIISVLLTAWIFAFFEIFVSGFSRHRMALVVILLAVNCLPPTGNIRKRTTKHP